MIVACALGYTFRREDDKHFIRTRSDGCMVCLGHCQRSKIAPFVLYFCLLVRARSVSGCPHDRGGSRCDPSSACAFPNNQMVTCTMHGVQVYSKARLESTTYRAYRQRLGTCHGLVDRFLQNWQFRWAHKLIFTHAGYKPHALRAINSTSINFFTISALLIDEQKGQD